MPELAVKMRIAPSNNRRMISGTSHHFFSCLANLRNSLRSDHMSCFQFGVIELLVRKNHGAFLINAVATRRASGAAFVHIEVPWHLPDLAQELFQIARGPQDNFPHQRGKYPD